MRHLPQKLIKLGFFLLYNQLAFSYDLVAWLVSWGQWANWRRVGLQYLQPGSTLELAYGSGGLYVDMALAGINPIGIDLSPYMARLTAKKLRRSQLTGAILRARAQELPFPKEYFANAIATFPTNYIFEKETLSEIHRVLAAQPEAPARLIIVMRGDLNKSRWINGTIEWLYRITGQRDTLVPDPISLLEEAGFEARWETNHFQSATASLILAQKL